MVKYFTDPNAIEPPDMELLFPFVDSALPLAYGVLGVLLFHVRNFIFLVLATELWANLHQKLLTYMIHEKSMHTVRIKPPVPSSSWALIYLYIFI